MPYIPIENGEEWPTYSQQRGRFDGAAEALRAPEYKIETLRNWKVGDLIRHPNGQSICIGFDYSDLIWLRETGFTYLSNPHVMIDQFHHNTGLQYRYISEDQVQRDFATGLFTPYFNLLS